MCCGLVQPCIELHVVMAEQFCHEDHPSMLVFRGGEELLQAQKQGMAVIAAAYQQLACDTAEEWLALTLNADENSDGRRQSVLKILSGASTGGNSRIQRALNRLNESSACVDLIFRT